MCIINLDISTTNLLENFVQMHFVEAASNISSYLLTPFQEVAVDSLHLLEAID